MEVRGRDVNDLGWHLTSDFGTERGKAREKLLKDIMIAVIMIGEFG